MNIIATKQPAPAAAAGTLRRPYVGARVYFYDTERPGEFNNIGKGPYTATVVQTWKGAAGEVNLEAGLYVLSDQGGQNHRKVVHASQREETRAKRYWDWMPAGCD
jgi:hypothetical protein